MADRQIVCQDLSGRRLGIQRARDGGDLAGVVRIGCVTALLQGGGEGARVTARVERRGIARRAFAAQQRHIVLEACRRGVVASKLTDLAHGGAVLVLGGACADRAGARSAAGLHAEEIVARAAAGIARQGLAPVGLERCLRDEVARIDAEFLAGLLRLRQEFADEVGALRGARAGRAHGGAGGGRGGAGSRGRLC